MEQFNDIYVGLDVHKATIAVAVVRGARGQAQYLGEYENTPEAVRKLVKKISPDGEVVNFCYEAGPCGYELHHQLTGMGHACDVVAPSLIPRKAGVRIKTDRRDAQSLAKAHASGDLTAVWVPDKAQEGMRDLSRAREDFKQIETKARQRLGAFLLRNGKIYPGKSKWTQAHWRWMETLAFETPLQHIVMQEYIEAVRDAQRRVHNIEGQIRLAVRGWSLEPVFTALMAMRGISVTSAVTVLAELGDLSRFDSPRQLMAYLGLVPSEHSSGGKRRQGALTKTGNGHVRRVLVESAWNYRFPARKSETIQRRAEKTSEAVQAIAWQGQQRLCARYKRMEHAGKPKQLVTAAIARELCGFIWAVACEASGKAHGSRATA